MERTAISDVVNYLGDPRVRGVSGLLYEASDVTFAWGDRLHEFQEPITDAKGYVHAELGKFDVRGDVVRALRRQRGTKWELEVVLRDSPAAEALRRMVGYAVPDERLVDELVRAYADDASKRSSAITDSHMFPSLVEQKAHRIDVMVATVWVDRGFEFCLRLVRVFWTADWLLTIWKPAGLELFSTFSDPVPAKWDTESDDARSAALPARRPSHLPGDPPTGIGGREALLRLAYFVAGHHEWSVGVSSEMLERWQSNFFAEAGDGQGVDPLQLMAPLSDVGRSIVMMRPALQRLHSAFKSAPFRDDPELGRAADRDASALGDVSGEVRDAYAIAASAASLYQAFQAERKMAADRRLQRVASVLAALVLAPGLVATLYGADVMGLPGQGTNHGLIWVGIASAVGALIILLVLLLALRTRDTEP
jgi:hypothetical protein